MISGYGFVTLLGATIMTLTASALASKKPPQVDVPKVTFGSEHKHWREPFDDVYAKLKNNLHEKHGLFLAQSSPNSRGVYLWDSAFISQVWLKVNPAVAKDVIRSVLYNQQLDGRIPHVVSLFGTSPWTQPPLLAWAAKNIVEKTGDRAFAAEVLPALQRYHEWLVSERRGPEGLFFWAHPYESGLENSPRFSDRAEKHFSKTKKQRAVDLSAYMIMDAEALASLAESRGIDGDQDVATEYRREARDIRDLMQKHMWNEADGQFYDYLPSTKAQLKKHTWVTFLALTAGVATPSQATKLMAHLTSSREYATEIPFATVQRNAIEFEKDSWRGPVWVNSAYLMILGLERYNEHKSARELAARLVDGVYRAWQIDHTFYEYYDPDAPVIKDLTRKEGNLFKQITLGSKPIADYVGWTGLVNNLVVDYGLGQN
jgi:neutral trehalase